MKAKKKSKSYFLIIVLLISIFTIGVKSTYAFYNTSEPVIMLTSRVGDFNYGSADINIIIYKESAKSSGAYLITNAVPTNGYTLNNASCYDPNSREIKACTSGGSGDCTYTYSAGQISLTSNSRITCKFYFNVN